MAHLQNEIVSACTKNAQAMYDSDGSGNHEYLASEIATGTSTPSIEQIATVVNGEGIFEISIEALKDDIQRCSHVLSTTIERYQSSGKHAVDDDLHVS